MGLPEDLQAASWDGEKYASLRQHGLVPVLQGGNVANYAKDNGIVYAPQPAQIGDEEAPVLTPQGPLAPGGTIIEYASPDGKVVRYVRAGIACPTDAVCMQVVSYNPEDLATLYWVQLDKETGEFLGYMSAFTDNPSSRGEWLPVGEKWTSSLSGPTALLAGEGYGIAYELSVDKSTNILFFASGGSEYQAKDRDIHYSPRDKRLWIDNESGIFLFDQTTHEWTRLADQGTQMLAVGDKQMIIADEAWLAVSSIDGSSGVQVVTTEDGQQWVWGQAGWEKYKVKIDVALFSPEVTAALEKNGLSVAPEDFCLWEGTEGATVQCLTLNPENVPELKQTLSKLNNTVGWLSTWSVRDKKPGKYPTLASYEAMLKNKPMQLAMDVGMVWHPDNKGVLPTEGVMRPASEWEIDGVRVGNGALIDTSQIGMEIVDWTEAQQEGGYIGLGAGLCIKQELVPVEGVLVNGQQVFRVVLRFTDLAVASDNIKYDGDGDGVNDYGILIPDLSLPIADNARAWNQLMNYLGDVADGIGRNPKTTVVDNYWDTLEFTAGGEVILNKEIMDEMAEGIEFFDAEPQ
ncbi:MAG: hypothetical protein B6D38_08770 [Anaerolineae bacterium UTCFX1]|nr:MAG: hypothetical protein B6D38_08770 [Anaerolineae bacterium UTCFX1]